jgi:hypothetical protein
MWICVSSAVFSWDLASGDAGIYTVVEVATHHWGKITSVWSSGGHWRASMRPLVLGTGSLTGTPNFNPLPESSGPKGSQSKDFAEGQNILPMQTCPIPSTSLPSSQGWLKWISKVHPPTKPLSSSFPSSANGPNPTSSLRLSVSSALPCWLCLHNLSLTLPVPLPPLSSILHPANTWICKTSDTLALSLRRPHQWLHPWLLPRIPVLLPLLPCAWHFVPYSSLLLYTCCFPPFTQT